MNNSIEIDLNRLQTPYYLISEEVLSDNIKSFQGALNQLWPNSYLSYSVKTNSLPWLLSYIKEKQIMAEVVSDEEYQLAKLKGYKDCEIVFNGPIKGEIIFREACMNGAYVNLDSKNDIKLIKKYGKKNTNVGIRVNVDPSVFDERDIGYARDGFRFGFSEESGELSEVISVVKDVCGENRLGLHMHCNSITRSKSVYVELAKYVVNIIKKYKFTPSFIDMGGGYFGGVPGKTTAYEYIKAIKDELLDIINPDETKLIIEPGSAIIGSAVDLHTSVVDTKDTSKARIVTTNGSRIHIDPLWKKNNYLYTINQTESKEIKDRQVICGYTCMDHDRLMIIENQPELCVGDEIVYRRVGAYSMTFGGMFINYYPDVYVDDGKKVIKVRTKINVNDYDSLHS